MTGSEIECTLPGSREECSHMINATGHCARSHCPNAQDKCPKHVDAKTYDNVIRGSIGSGWDSPFR